MCVRKCGFVCVCVCACARVCVCVCSCLSGRVSEVRVYVCSQMLLCVGVHVCICVCMSAHLSGSVRACCIVCVCRGSCSELTQRFQS